MTTIYEFDSERIYTGRSQEVADGVPMGWARGPMPALTGNQVARHVPGIGWYVIESRPAKPAHLLDRERAQAWERIKALREAKQDGGVEVSSKWYHTDTKSRVQQLALMGLAQNLPQGIQWKTMDNSFVELTPELLQSVFTAQLTRELAVFQRAEVLRAAVNASDDPASIDITTGWPASFQS